METKSIMQKQKAAAAETGKSDKPKDLYGWVSKYMPEVEKALPAVLTPERFARITLSALSANPQLQQCTPRSFLGAMLTSAQLGLEPNTPLGQAYLIPRRNGKTQEWECQFQLGYKGLIDMAHRSEDIRDIQAHVVYSGDEFVYELGLDPKLIHKPAATNRGVPTHFYAVYHTRNGGYGFEVMSVEDVRKHAEKFSDSFNRGAFSPWKTNFEEMAKKTALKRALKYAPMSAEYVRAVLQDETIKTKLSADMFDVPDETIITEFTDETIDPETGEIREAKADA